MPGTGANNASTHDGSDTIFCPNAYSDDDDDDERSDSTSRKLPRSTLRGAVGVPMRKTPDPSSHPLSGLTVSTNRKVLDERGELAGLVTQGHTGLVVRYQIDKAGCIVDGSGQVMGYVKTLEQLDETLDELDVEQE